jgi:predicted pyridoxine 5'-phosphate oxidase superfamily flavin-nucleotide-binding protein
VVIGVSGVNHYAQTAGLVFATQDRDLFLPLDPDNALRAWQTCRDEGLELWCNDEPLGKPMDRILAEQVISRRALVRAEGQGLLVDLSLVMAGFAFDDVWPRRRVFKVEGVEIPVASLKDIVASKAAAGRPKDRLFLATHEEALRELGRRRRGRDSARTTK